MKELFKTPMKGKIVYDEINGCYELQTQYLSYGIMAEGFWDDFDNKEVEVYIKVIEKGSFKEDKENV